MKSKLGTAAALASVSVLGVGTLAIAANRDGPRVHEVQADIVYRHASVDFRLCEGPQGPFREGRVVVTGPSHGDVPLTGQVTAKLRYLWDDQTGDGFQRGTLIVQDPQTGRVKAKADFVDASIAEITQGTLVGSVRDDHRTLIADWRTTWHVNGAVTAQIGGLAADRRLPAVVVRGHCTGPFEHIEEDFPPPPGTAPGGAAPAARIPATDSRHAWRRP